MTVFFSNVPSGDTNHVPVKIDPWKRRSKPHWETLGANCLLVWFSRAIMRYFQLPILRRPSAVYLSTKYGTVERILIINGKSQGRKESGVARSYHHQGWYKITKFSKIFTWFVSHLSFPVGSIRLAYLPIDESLIFMAHVQGNPNYTPQNYPPPGIRGQQGLLKENWWLITPC